MKLRPESSPTTMVTKKDVRTMKRDLRYTTYAIEVSYSGVSKAASLRCLLR